MIDRDKLPYIENILSLHNDSVDLTEAHKVITSIKNDRFITFLRLITTNIHSMDLFKKIVPDILEGEKEGNLHQFYTNLLKLTNPELDREYLSNVLLATRRFKDRQDDILDSFSPNQMASKTELLNAVKNLNILNKDSTVVIWGCWYASVLVPMLHKEVKRIIGIDLDNKSIKIAQNTLFDNLDNVEFTENNVFSEKYKNFYLDTNLIINTSCEHMPPMKEWKWFGAGALEDDTNTTVFRTPKLPNDCYFAFQSNNMFGIEGHINCVNSIDEFKDQLPERAEVLYEEEIEDTRGTRYMLVGKFMSL